MLIRDYGQNIRAFYCPGCGHAHSIDISPGRWSLTEDSISQLPTISPSVLCFYQHPETKDRVTVCHLFVKAGKIEFLSDCRHQLAGQTVDMVPFPENYG